MLYYWRSDNYRQDRAFGFGYHLNQGSPLLSRLERGAHVWAFTRRARDGAYVLAADLVVGAVTANRAGYRYGRWRVWGDLERTRYFDVDHGPDAEPVLRSLTIRAASRHLGQSFQGYAAVRPLRPDDAARLADFAAYLPMEPRVPIIYTEDQFEAAFLQGGIDLVRHHMVRETAADLDVRQAYLYRPARVARSQALARELYQLYEGRCQLCGMDPGKRLGAEISQAHHVVWLSRGGDDELENLVLLCPNHHRSVHVVDAPLDYRGPAFLFPNGVREEVRINRHLPVAR
ncbi:HNH endonuclease [Limnochorda pilosa]|uniref:HNH endonuclease n=1 Tax=Limnochorda pilosa TaxID=1555112 RepID=UPI001E5A0F89|nr:HNH endonuclease signature motif containing protein [Limnochorda pilosa]